MLFLQLILKLLEWLLNGREKVSNTDNRKDLLTVSDNALAEIQARVLKGGFSSGVAVRVSPTKWADGEVDISFDDMVGDDRDWEGRSRGLLLLIDKRDEDQLSGCQLDFRDSTFFARLV